MKKFFKLFSMMVLFVLTVVTGASSGVMMANVVDLPDAGKSNQGTGGDTATSTSNGVTATGPYGPDGIATETKGREITEGDNNPEFYSKDVDKRITKIRPMATPIDQISRYAKAQPSDSFEVKYHSVGTRPIRTTLSTAVPAPGATNGWGSGTTSLPLTVADPNMFTLDDTIRCVGVQAKTKADGTAYVTSGANADTNIPDLVLHVCGRDNTGKILVYAVNGTKPSGSNETIVVPAIPADTVLVRMGKACGELDVQTGRFNNIPTAEIQYCQNFMIQVEQSTFDKIAAKEVDWSFSDIEEDGIYDMRLSQENTYLWGVKRVIHHVTKDGMATWFTGGIWWMAGQDIEVGHWDSTVGANGAAVISDDDLVDMAKDLFVGTGLGNKRKILFAGSDMVAAFSKIKSEKFRLKDTVEIWNLKFKSWDTDFGEILMMHHELFDYNGMADCGFALDPEYLTKKTHVSWSRNILDLKKAGVRNTDAVVMQEVACLYLRYAKAHARMKLATAPGSGN